MFAVLFIVCGITGVMGRPSVNIITEGLVLPPWPPENVFLLPTILNIDDVINVTLLYGNTPSFAINLISIDSKSNSLNIICNITVDVKRNMIIIQSTESYDEFDLDFEENETMFNLSFKRRKSRLAHADGDLLSINGKTFVHSSKLKGLDNLRMLQFIGDNIKVSKLEFQFNSM